MSVTVALALAAAVAGALGLAPRFTERRRVRRELRRHPLLTASSAEGEHVRVVGVVRAFERTLVAPISARTCVAYRSRVRANMARSSSATQRTSLQGPRAESLLIAPFLVDCGAAGTVIVDGDHARFDLKATRLTDADAERKLSFLARHGYSSQGHASGSFTEVVIEPGMTIAVSGVMMRDVPLAPASSEVAFREGPPPTIRLTGNHDHPLVIGETRIPLALR